MVVRAQVKGLEQHVQTIQANAVDTPHNTVDSPDEDPLKSNRSQSQLQAIVIYEDGTEATITRPDESSPFVCGCGAEACTLEGIMKHTISCDGDPGSMMQMGTEHDILVEQRPFIYRLQTKSDLVAIPGVDKTRLVINKAIPALVCIECGVLVGIHIDSLSSHLSRHNWGSYLDLVLSVGQDQTLGLLANTDSYFIRVGEASMMLQCAVEGIMTLRDGYKCNYCSFCCDTDAHIRAHIDQVHPTKASTYEFSRCDVQYANSHQWGNEFVGVYISPDAPTRVSSEIESSNINEPADVLNDLVAVKLEASLDYPDTPPSHEMGVVQPDHILHDDFEMVHTSQETEPKANANGSIKASASISTLPLSEYMEKIDHQTIQSITAKPTGVFLNEESIADIRQSIAEGSICWTGLTKEFLVQYYTKLCSKIGGAYGISYVLRRALCNSKRDTLSKKLFRPLCESSSIDTHTETAMHLISVVMKLCQSTNDMLGQIPLEPIRAAIECLRAAILNAVEKFPEFEANTIYTAIQKAFRAIFCTDLAISKSRIHHGVFWFVVFDARLDATTTKDADGITRTIEQLLYLCRSL
ncbi:hypothetical protein BASA81_018071 [Batrachochytrium salamandrivorans]|nr:hypothetical protein BASA81_018071 [Batrachochytrium salamandrivorans]